MGNNTSVTLAYDLRDLNAAAAETGSPLRYRLDFQVRGRRRTYFLSVDPGAWIIAGGEGHLVAYAIQVLKRNLFAQQKHEAKAP